MVLAYVGGNAARSERYMRDHWAAAKGLLPAAELARSAAREEEEHLHLQQEAGLDLLSPAYVRREDILRPLYQAPGASLGPLARTFETNTFHRQPLVGSGPTALAAPSGWWEEPLPRPAVVTLPSPWDVALRVRDTGGRDVTDLALAYGEALRPVVAGAVGAGAELVRLHDPSILYARAARRDVDVFAQALAEATRGHAERCTLHLTNGDPFAHPKVLESNPLGGLSIEDPGYAPPRGLVLAPRTRLTLALVRGDSSLVEDPAALAQRAGDLARRLGLPVWGLTNGWDLEHVPHATAARKVHALGQARRLLRPLEAAA